MYWLLHFKALRFLSTKFIFDFLIDIKFIFCFFFKSQYFLKKTFIFAGIFLEKKVSFYIKNTSKKYISSRRTEKFFLTKLFHKHKIFVKLWSFYLQQHLHSHQARSSSARWNPQQKADGTIDENFEKKQKKHSKEHQKMSRP
jgi:hypothetical protein